MHQWLLRLSFLAPILLFVGCGKNEEIIRIEEEPIPEPIELIQASISGEVQTSDGAPIEGAQIGIYDAKTRTDENGYYQVSDELIPRQGALVEVAKDGFFTGYTLIQVQKGGKNYQPMQLATHGNFFQFENTNGFSWISPEGITLNIPPMGVTQSDGTPEAGLISVAIRWSSSDGPATDFSNQQIIRGIRESREEVAIQHGGILQLDIRNLSGEALTLTSAEFHLPVDQLAEPQGDIQDLALWHLAPDGFWRQADSIQLDGQHLITHLSGNRLWSIGLGGPLQTVEGQLLYKDQHEISRPLPFQAFEVLSQKGFSPPLDMVSDDKGRYRIYVPGDDRYQVRVPAVCGQDFSIHSPPDWAPATALSSIEIGYDMASPWQQRRFADCDGEPILEGYLCIKSGQLIEQIIPLQSSDSGRVYLPVCQPENVSFDLFDQEGMNLWSARSRFPFMKAEQGVIPLCDTLSVFFDLSINGNDYSFANCQAFLVKDDQHPGQKVIHLVAFNAPFTSQSDFIDMWIAGDAPGELGMQSIAFRIRSFQNDIIEGMESQVVDVRANIDLVGDVDQGVAGSIQGSMPANNQGVIELSAQFNALRLN